MPPPLEGTAAPALTAWKSTMPTAKHDAHVVAKQETARPLEDQVRYAIAAARTITYRAPVATEKTCAEVKRILRSFQKKAQTRTIPYAAMSETSLNCWNLSVINVFSCSACSVGRPSMVSWMAA